MISVDPKKNSAGLLVAGNRYFSPTYVRTNSTIVDISTVPNMPPVRSDLELSSPTLFAINPLLQGNIFEEQVVVQVQRRET